MASRLLRVNLLSPITVQTSIDARLDVVEEFIRTEDRYSEVRDALKAFNKMDFDKLIVLLASQEVRVANTAKVASSRVLQMLNLRNVVKNLPLLQKALAGSQSQLLRIIHDLISDERLAKIDSLVTANLNEDGAPAKGGISAVNARVYAVKAHRNRLLDVARETYKENVGDIFQLNRTLSEEHELPLTLVYQETGFVFSLKKTDLEGELPPGFINVSVKKGKWVFTSMDLQKMNARMKDALDETLMLSDKIVQDLVVEILADVGALYKASEAVALVDMLWSFAHSSIMHNYGYYSIEFLSASNLFNDLSSVRPEFTGTLAIKSGRHPILETIQSAGTLVPNDVYCDDSSSFQIIQGPNMSGQLCAHIHLTFQYAVMAGKSTYLRQIGLLTVMAMSGCFVPAEYASFRIHDALLTRLSNDDDLEKSLSTFASLATPNSLVLVDELGRGTSPRDGLGISHAIAEELIALKARCVYFWPTSYDQSPYLLQPFVFFATIVDGAPEDSNHYGVAYLSETFELGHQQNHLGLELARLADLPDDVLIEGKRVAEALAALHARHEEESESSQAAVRRKALLRLRTQLIQAFEHSALPDQELLAYLHRFQDDIAKAFLDMK
ncbi:hypothetical protein C0995_005543 [Termitomyces sp. Mi166|nr:hypothetical protein C0995_005543 [Termitomyces sp. Mi166\